MAQYNTGTVSVTNGSNIVTGTGTAFLANVSVGDLFARIGDGVSYEVASVDNDTQITLAANYAGTTGSGVNYTIHIDFTADGLPLLKQGDLESNVLFSRAMKTLQDLHNFKVATVTPSADADYTLTDEEAAADVLVIGDGDWSTDRNIIAPDKDRRYYCIKTGVRTATVKTTAGTGAEVAPDEPRTVIVRTGVGADYAEGQPETGTFDASITFGGASTGVTYQRNEGFYVKRYLGGGLSQVDTWCYIKLSSKGTATGDAQYTNLPFTIYDLSDNYNPIGSCRLRFVSYVGLVQMIGGGAVVNFEELSEAGTQSTLTDADFSNNSGMAINISYLTQD